MRLAKGMLIKTNYSGPYRILDIERNCTCVDYCDEINEEDPCPQPPHMHITCTNPDGKGLYYLEYFDKDTLLSLDKTYCGMKKEPGYDWIEILTQDKPVQLELF